MTKEDKDLLLQDLSARLPYGVKLSYDGEYGKEPRPFPLNELNRVTVNSMYEIEGIKPYLRPMVTMTEEEIKELAAIDTKRMIFSGRHLTWHLDGEIIDYLNKNMFDWRHLIPKGLALPLEKESKI